MSKALTTLFYVLLMAGFSQPVLAHEGATPMPGTAETEEMYPFPPKTLEEVHALMLLVEDECHLPCFWGFRPDESTINDIVFFIARSLDPMPTLARDHDFSGQTGQSSRTYHLFGNDPKDIHISIAFWTDGDILSRMHALIDDPSIWVPAGTYDLIGLLTRLESQPEIYVTINQTTELFSFILLYDEVGVLARYIFDFQGDQFTLSDQPIQLCPRLEQNRLISLHLQSEDNESSLADRISLETFRRSKDYILIEEISEIDTEVFIERILENPDFCVEILSYRELLDKNFGL